MVIKHRNETLSDHEAYLFVSIRICQRIRPLDASKQAMEEGIVETLWPHRHNTKGMLTIMLKERHQT